MKPEFEAKFLAIDKAKVRTSLTKAGALLKKPEAMQKRIVFKPPRGHGLPGGWLRVRDEGDVITMSLKLATGHAIGDIKEICLTIDNFAEGVEFLLSIGCEKTAYQESKRELWLVDGVEITLDEWPFLEPFVEIEGATKHAVKRVSEKLGFDYETAYFCPISKVYNLKYGCSEDSWITQPPNLVFGSKNPFL